MTISEDVHTFSQRASATAADSVEQRLAADICSGRLPPGAKLAFDMLRTRYGVGLSPLREALQRMVAQNLVTVESHVGFRVAPLSVDELHEVHALRKQLCGDALRNSIENGTVAWEARVLAAAHELGRMPVLGEPHGDDADQWHDAHRQFHWVLISACRSKWLLQFCRVLDAQFVRYRRIAIAHQWQASNFTERVHREHSEIAEAAIRRNPDLAVQLLLSHFDLNSRDVFRLTEQQLGGKEVEKVERNVPRSGGSGAKTRE